jgi:hypothetical protein
MSDNSSPFITEDFLASIVEALKFRGDALAIAIIVESECRLVLWESNSNYGDYYQEWRLFIDLPVSIFYALSNEERQIIEKTIEEVASLFFIATPSDALHSVVIAPKVSEAKGGWREDAIRFIKGEGITNQGRVRSDNIASKQHKGLLFRSMSEITLFEALTRAGLAVAPLPVFVRIGKTYNRIEPDFVVISKGLTFVVEVDGDTYHKELPAEAEKRLIPLTYEGVEVRRIRAVDLNSDAAADKAVQELINFMSKRKESR